MKYESDKDFFQKALGHTKSELRSVRKLIWQMDEIIAERNEYHKKMPGFNAYKNSKESTEYWNLHKKMKAKKAKAFDKLNNIVKFAMELEKIYKKRRLKDLFNKNFGDDFKTFVIDVLHIPYPRNGQYVHYRFKAVWLDWLGFEWIKGKGWHYQGILYNA